MKMKELPSLEPEDTGVNWGHLTSVEEYKKFLKVSDCSQVRFF